MRWSSPILALQWMNANNLIISPDYPPPLIGGSLVYLNSLVKNSNLDFTILSDKKFRKNTKNITFIDSKHIVNSGNPKKIHLFFMYLYLIFKIYEISRHKIVILNISAIGNGFFSYLLSKFRTKVVILVFAEEITLALNAKGISGFLKRICLNGYKSADKLISVSNFAKDILIKKVNVKKDIFVIPTPVHDSKYNLDAFINRKHNTQFKILSVGRLIKRKGFIYLLKAFSEVIKSFDNVYLSIVGDGPEINNIIEFIDKNNLKEKVIIHKKVSDQFLAKQYISHDLFILANLMLENGDCEGAPNVLIEAASFGLPTIAGIEGGTSDVVDNNKSGILINPRDTQTFSKQIISFLKSREKCNLYGKNGFFKAMNSHNKEKAGNSFRDIIERLSANNI